MPAGVYIPKDTQGPAADGIFEYLARDGYKLERLSMAGVTVTHTGAVAEGTVSMVVDGDSTTRFRLGTSAVGTVDFDFGAGNAVAVGHMVMYSNAGYSLGTSIWYSDDGSTWTQAHSFTTALVELRVDLPSNPGTHRYWRLRGEPGINKAWTQIHLYEWSDATTAWANPDTVRGHVSTSMSSVLSGLVGSNAFTIGSLNGDRFHTNNEASAWWQVDFGAGEGVVLESIEYRHPASPLYPRTYKVQGMVDGGSIWVDLASDTLSANGYITATGSHTWVAGIPISDTTKYRYIRIISTVASVANYVTGASIEFYGTYGTVSTGPASDDDWHATQAFIEIATGKAVEEGVAEWDVDDWDVGVWGGTETTWSDVSDDYIQASVRASTRTRFGSRYGPATATVTLANSSGDYSPSGADPVAIIGRKLRIRAELDGESFDRFVGVISDVTDRDVPGLPRQAVVSCIGAFSMLSRIERVPLTSPIGSGELSGTRARRILDGANVKGDDRIVGDGTQKLQGTLMGGSPLDELYLVADSEGGELFVDRSGRVVFRDADEVASIATGASELTVAGYEQPDGSSEAWAYWASYVPTYTLSDVVNTVSLQRVGGAPQRRVDTQSRQQYGLSSVTRSDLLNVNDAFPATLAQRILDARAQPYERVKSARIVAGDLEAAVAALGLNQGSPIKVRRTVGGTQISADAVVAGWSETFRPGRIVSATVRRDIWVLDLEIDQSVPAADLT